MISKELTKRRNCTNLVIAGATVVVVVLLIAALLAGQAIRLASITLAAALVGNTSSVVLVATFSFAPVVLAPCCTITVA